MKVTTIKYLERFNKGNYEHVEVQFEAVLDENESSIDVLHTLRLSAHNFFYSKMAVEKVVEEAKQVEEVKEEKPAKEKKSKKAKAVEEKSASEKAADVVDGVEVPPVIPSEAQEEMEVVESPYKAPKNVVTYDLKNKDHRDRLAAYLNKTFPAWKSKPKDQLLAMSQELSGKPFEDSNGSMLDSFKNILSSYFE